MTFKSYLTLTFLKANDISAARVTYQEDNAFHEYFSATWLDVCIQLSWSNQYDVLAGIPRDRLHDGIMTCAV